MINVTITSGDLRKLEKTLTDRAAVRAYKVAEFAAGQLEEEVVDIVKYYFVNDRPPVRRKKGATHLVNSFVGRVEGVRGQLPVNAVLAIKRGVNEKKVAALEYGSPSHEIKGNPWLAFPRSVLGEGTLDDLEARSRIRNAYGGRGPRGGKNYFATQGVIMHPGNKAYNFMKQARDRVRRTLRTR
jgi:hypothetical protein